LALLLLPIAQKLQRGQRSEGAYFKAEKIGYPASTVLNL